MLKDRTNHNSCPWDASSQGGEFGEQVNNHPAQPPIAPGMSATEQGHTNIPGAHFSHCIIKRDTDIQERFQKQVAVMMVHQPTVSHMRQLEMEGPWPGKEKALGCWVVHLMKGCDYWERERGSVTLSGTRKKNTEQWVEGGEGGTCVHTRNSWLITPGMAASG